MPETRNQLIVILVLLLGLALVGLGLYRRSASRRDVSTGGRERT